MSEVRYCGRSFSSAELEVISQLCQQLPTRAAIARAVCEQLDWRRHDGQLKAMSARLALIRMEHDGLIRQPSPTKGNANRRWPLRLPSEPELFPPEPVDGPLRQLGPLQIRPVFTSAQSRSWNQLIARHHYLGYVPLSGAQRRYFVEAGGQLLALFGMGAAAWTCQPRDSFIGWDHDTRMANLHLVVGNARFLILPWVHVPHLASAALGLLARTLPDDWHHAYGYRPALLETFVQSDRFSGTSYRAANWTLVGQTQGRGKLDRTHLHAQPIKHIFLLPFAKDFRRRLGVIS